MAMPNLQEFLERFRLPLLVALAGVVLIGIGVLAILFSSQKEDKIEIISGESSTEKGTIFVDIQGAVVNPGVYELPIGSRLDDLLTRAGGLSVEADRDWVSLSLNRAQKLTDGAKIYIPERSEAPRSPDPPAGGRRGEGGQVSGSTTGLVNVNTASASELDTLWGIGPVTAQKIIDNRPYQNIEELLTKKILKQNVYEQNRQKLTVF